MQAPGNRVPGQVSAASTCQLGDTPQVDFVVPPINRLNLFARRASSATLGRPASRRFCYCYLPARVVVSFCCDQLHGWLALTSALFSIPSLVVYWLKVARRKWNDARTSTLQKLPSNRGKSRRALPCSVSSISRCPSSVVHSLERSNPIKDSNILHQYGSLPTRERTPHSSFDS